MTAVKMVWFRIYTESITTVASWIGYGLRVMENGSKDFGMNNLQNGVVSFGEDGEEWIQGG